MRAWALALLLVFGFVLFGCIQPNASTPEVIHEINETPQVVVESTPDLSEPCSDATGVLSSDECFLNLATHDSDSTYCERIYAVKTRDKCYDHFSSTDEKMCAKIVSPTLRSNCYFDSAKRLNNTDLCVKISDTEQKQKCLVELSPPCSFESNENAKSKCLALYHNASSFCQNNDCLYALGVTNLNLAACNDIDEANRAKRSACRAVVLDDINVCNETGIDLIADYCYSLVAYSTDKYSYCTLGSDGSRYTFECLTNFAIENSDPSLCKYTDSELDRDNCYLNYSISTGNFSICDKIINSLLDSECRIKTAMRYGDLAACNKLQYKGKTNCYNLVISGSVPIVSKESCYAINDEDVNPWRYKCLSSYAWQVKDGSICSEIEDTKYKSECDFRFS